VSGDKIAYNGCEHEQCGFGANQLSLTTNLVGTTHFHNQKTSIAYACCYVPLLVDFMDKFLKVQNRI